MTANNSVPRISFLDFNFINFHLPLTAFLGEYTSSLSVIFTSYCILWYFGKEISQLFPFTMLGQSPTSLGSFVLLKYVNLLLLSEAILEDFLENVCQKCANIHITASLVGARHRVKSQFEVKPFKYQSTGIWSSMSAALLCRSALIGPHDLLLERQSP